MEDFVNKISFSFIVGYVFFGLFLFVLLYVINTYVIPLLDNYNHKFSKFWKKLQVVIWIFFFSLFFYQSFREDMTITLAFGVLIIGLGWSYWRNVFSGLLILFGSSFKVGDYISTSFATGELTKLRLAQSELLNDQGELVIIPNHTLRNTVLKQIAKKSNVKTYSFKIKTAENKTINDIRQLTITCPYISANQPIVVETTSKSKFTVKCAVIDPNYLDKVREYLEQTL